MGHSLPCIFSFEVSFGHRRPLSTSDFYYRREYGPDKIGFLPKPDPQPI